MGKYYCKVSGRAGPKVPHKTLAEAYIEARRLFDQNGRTRRVYVLEAIGTIEPEEATAAKDRRVTAGSEAELGTVG